MMEIERWEIFGISSSFSQPHVFETKDRKHKPPTEWTSSNGTVCKGQRDQVKGKQATHRHLGVLAPLVRGDAHGGLERALDVALVGVHVQQL